MDKKELNKIIRKIRKLELSSDKKHCDKKISVWQLNGFYQALSDVINLLKEFN